MDIQERVKSQVTHDQFVQLEDNQDIPKPKMIRVPMPTFPPTAMVYSVNKVPPQSNNPETSGKVNNVSTSLIAQVLSHPEPTSKPRRIFICKLCAKDFVFTHQSTQTNFSYNQDTNGYSGGLSQMTAARTNHPHYHGHIMPPGVHRPRLNSTETEI